MQRDLPDPHLAAGRAPATTLTLCDALLDLQLGHAGSPPATLRRSAEAARLLLAFLTPVARGLQSQFRGVFDADDLVQAMVLTLAQRGPMRGQAKAPATDEEATRLLRRAARNLAIDRQRSHRRRGDAFALSIGPGDDDHPAVDPAADLPRADDALEETERERDETARIAAADGTLDAIEAELCHSREARRSGTGHELARQLQQLRRAASGALDVGALAREELRAAGGEPQDSKALAKARNAIDARFKRGRAALIEALDQWIAAEQPGEVEARLLQLRLARRIALQGQEPLPASDQPPPGRRGERGHVGPDDRGAP